MSQQVTKRPPHRPENVALLFDILWPVGSPFCEGGRTCWTCVNPLLGRFVSSVANAPHCVSAASRLLDRLQWLLPLNAEARLGHSAHKYDRISPLLSGRSPPLRVPERIKFRPPFMCLLLAGSSAPVHLAGDGQTTADYDWLRSTSRRKLIERRSRLTTYDWRWRFQRRWLVCPMTYDFADVVSHSLTHSDRSLSL